MNPPSTGPGVFEGKNLGPLKGKGWPGPKGSLPMGPKGMGKGAPWAPVERAKATLPKTNSYQVASEKWWLGNHDFPYFLVLC